VRAQDRRWRVRTLAGLVALVLHATATLAGSLVDDVVRMLEEEVDPSVISSWLELQEPATVAPSPDDLIRLSRAGAPDELVRKLLALGPRPAPPAPRRAPSAAPVAAATADGDGKVPLAVSVSYHPHASFDMEDQDKLELYVYLDGALLTHLEPQSRWSPSRDPAADLALAPGAHDVRLLRESHESLGRKSGRWRHEARASPDVIRFELAPGHAWALGVEWTEPRFSGMQAPLTWWLLRDGERVAGAEKVGTPKDRWPHVCEDLESRIDPRETKPSRQVQRDRESCVRWSDLWSRSPVEAPPRAALLAELERTPVGRR